MIGFTNEDSMHTDYVTVPESGFYQITGTLNFEVLKAFATDLEHMTVSVMVRDRPDPKWVPSVVATKDIQVEYETDTGNEHWVDGTVRYRTKVNLHKGAVVSMYFAADYCEDADDLIFNNTTQFEVDLLWRDGYDYQEKEQPVWGFTEEQLESAGIGIDDLPVLETNPNGMTIHADPDACVQLYHNPGEYILQTQVDCDSHTICIYDNNEEIIRINCQTGEINFAPELKEPYKMMWLKLQEAFPQVFEGVEQANIKHTSNTSSYDRAMEFLK